MVAHTTMDTLADAKSRRFRRAERRGDVMRICFWMTQAAHDGRSQTLTRIVRRSDRAASVTRPRCSPRPRTRGGLAAA